MYGRDYGNRNFMERAANTVRGWFGGEHDYGRDYRGQGRDYDRSHRPQGGGYREMGDVSGYGRGGSAGGGSGYGAANWTGRNPDWNRGYGAGPRAGWGHADYDSYRTGGYQPQHGSWDVDWDESRGGYGASRGRESQGYGQNRGYDGRDYGARGRGYDAGMRGRSRPVRGYADDMRRGGEGGGYASSRGTGTWHPGQDPSDMNGGVGGSYGAYGPYGIERFRAKNSGGVSPGEYYTGYGIGTGYR